MAACGLPLVVHVSQNGAYQAYSRGWIGEDPPPTTRERRLISLLIRSSGFVDQILRQCARGNPVKASTSVLAESISRITAIMDDRLQLLANLAIVSGVHIGGVRVQVNMHEAKSQLSRLGRLAWEGEDIVIARAGEPYLRVTPYRQPERKPGIWKGRVWMATDFDDTSQDIIDSFNESDPEAFS